MVDLIEYMSMGKNKKDNLIVERAVNLSLIEIFLGSLLHTLRIPFSGHFLSLNQGFFLCYFVKRTSSRKQAAKSVFEISMVVAIMKSLAPIGKKLGPMISISMQGLWYSLGILVLGRGLLGQIAGMIFLSLWAFIQPFITYFLMYGTDLISAFEYFTNKMQGYLSVKNEILIFGITLLIGLKLIIASLIPIVLKFLKDDQVHQYEYYLKKISPIRKEKKEYSPLIGALKDITKLPMILSFLLMGCFFYFHGEEQALILWKILRAIAIAFIIFYLIRNPFLSKFIGSMAKKRSFLNRLYYLAGLGKKKIESLT